MRSSISAAEISDLFIRVVNRFNEMEKIPYFSGADLLLHLSEVHTIESIGKNEDINVTKLSKLQGVSKAAISQMIRKLVKKGLVQKSISPQTENEVVLRLTKKGKDVFEWHWHYHDRLNQEFAEIYAEMPAGAFDHLGELGMKLEKVFTKIIEERTALLKDNVSPAE